MSDNKQQLRVGILGAARIVEKVWPALHRAGHRVTVIGCRDAAKANAFIAMMHDRLTTTDEGLCPATLKQLPLGSAALPRVGSYDDVVAAADVDIVYIPIPVVHRDQWVRKCVAAGKHIVGEKPPAKDAAQLGEWLQLTKEAGLLYIDGTMFTHGLRLQKVKEHIASAVGSAEHHVAHIDVQACFNGGAAFLAEDIRMFPALEPHGALGDVGWYCIRWILHVMGMEQPSRVTKAVTTQRCPTTGAIVALEAEMVFEKDQQRTTTATLYCSFTEDLPMLARILTSNGTLFTVPQCIVMNSNDRALPPFYFAEEGASGPISARVSAADFDAYVAAHPLAKTLVGGEETYGNFQTDQMWRNISGAVNDAAQCATYGEYALKTQQLMDEIFVIAEKKSSE